MEAYIYDALRTPRGRGNRKGALIGTTATQLAVSVMHEFPLTAQISKVPVPPP